MINKYTSSYSIDVDAVYPAGDYDLLGNQCLVSCLTSQGWAGEMSPVVTNGYFQVLRMVIFKYLHYRYYVASVATCGDVATTCPPLLLKLLLSSSIVISNELMDTQ